MSPQQNSNSFANRNDTQTEIRQDLKGLLRKLNTMSSKEAKHLANDDLKSYTEYKNVSIEDKAMALL